MGQREKTEHAFNRITKDLKNNAIHKPLLFYGREKYLIDWAVGLLEKKWVDSATREMDYTVFSTDTTPFREIMDIAETFPMLSEKRLLVLRGGKSLEEELTAYLSQVPETCQVVLILQNPDKRTKAFKEALKNCCEYEFGILQETDLRKFMEKRFRNAGKTISISLLNQLIQRTGYYDKDSEYNLYNLENDTGKIIAHSMSPDIKPEDILAGVSGNMETNVFEMLDAISGNRKGEVFQILHNMMGSGDKIYYLLAVIIGQFETILEVKELREQGADLSQIHKLSGIHEFRIKKAMQHGEHISMSNLKKTLSGLYEIDRTIKNGLMDGYLALELIIASI